MSTNTLHLTAVATLDILTRLSRNSYLHHPLSEDIHRYTYNIPDTPLYKYLSIDFLLNYDLPIDRRALGRTIQNGMQRLRSQIDDHGDGYLLPDDDPWEIDDKRTGA